MEPMSRGFKKELERESGYMVAKERRYNISSGVVVERTSPFWSQSVQMAIRYHLQSYSKAKGIKQVGIKIILCMHRKPP